MKNPHISELGSKYIIHPKNKFGYCSPEFWEAEYKLWNLSKEQYHKIKKEQSPKCPSCGTPHGYSFGTGDCGCGVDY